MSQPMPQQQPVVVTTQPTTVVVGGCPTCGVCVQCVAAHTGRSNVSFLKSTQLPVSADGGKPPTTVTPDVFNDVTDVSHVKMNSHVAVTGKGEANIDSVRPNSQQKVNVLGAETALLWPREFIQGRHGERHKATAEAPDVTEGHKYITPSPVIVPDPYDLYANRIWLEGHVPVAFPDMATALQSALWESNHFQQEMPLSVHVVTSHYRQIYDGDKVTEVHYVVNYGDQTLQTVQVSRVISMPDTRESLHKKLAARHLREYKHISPAADKQSWTQLHMATVIITSCILALILLAVLAAIFARRRSGKKAPRTDKGPVVSADTSCDKRKLCSHAEDSPPPYSMENPLYQFETNAVMDGHTFP